LVAWLAACIEGAANANRMLTLRARAGRATPGPSFKIVCLFKGDLEWVAAQTAKRIIAQVRGVSARAFQRKRNKEHPRV